MKKVRINNEITAPELRIILDDGDSPSGEAGNIGVLPLKEALEKASNMGLDLVEISPTAKPPIAKIIDYGKYQYQEKKKDKERKQKASTIETKQFQIKIGTGEHDLEQKASSISKFLKEGHRVRIELFLRGRREKGKDQDFQRERLDRIMKLITEEYKVVEDYKKSPKGMSLTIEKKK